MRFIHLHKNISIAKQITETEEVINVDEEINKYIKDLDTKQYWVFLSFVRFSSRKKLKQQ